jgi:HEAT repeat protein
MRRDFYELIKRMNSRVVGVLLMFLGSACCHESEIPMALKGLYSSDPRDKNRALQVLARCPQQSESSVQRIAALMYDENVGVASSAAYALRKIDSKQAREALEQAISVKKSQKSKR